MTADTPTPRIFAGFKDVVLEGDLPSEKQDLEVWIEEDFAHVKVSRVEHTTIYNFKEMTFTVNGTTYKLTRRHLKHCYAMFEAMKARVWTQPMHAGLIANTIARLKSAFLVKLATHAFDIQARELPLAGHDVSTFTGNEESGFEIEEQTVTETERTIIGVIDYQFLAGIRVSFTIPRDTYEVILSPSLKSRQDGVTLHFDYKDKGYNVTVLDPYVK